MISSSGNIQIKEIIKLQKSAKHRRKEETFVIEGRKMFEEAKELQLIKKAYVSEAYYRETTEENPDYFKEVPYEIISENVLKEISDTVTPQGIIAKVKMPKYELESFFQGEKIKLLFLENLQDPGNLGTIMRTAEGAGMTGLILSKGSVDFYNPKTVRSTMGSLFRVPFVYVDNFAQTLQQAKEQGITLYAAHLQGKKDYDKEQWNKKSGILIGNEANGLSTQAAELADVKIKIPMCGKLESLNASVAAGILMYELLRQLK